MIKKIMVLSLGGSVIVQDAINIDYLKEFKKTILKNAKKNKFVIVCGGGKIARTYMSGLEEDMPYKNYFSSLLGIAATRLNARFMTYFFGNDANSGIPMDMKEVNNILRYNDIVFCGALRYSKNETSDSTAAKLANNFSSEFINITDVNGLYDKNPKKFKNARFIPEISSNEFLKIINKIKYKPGQHFILDQKAAMIIKKHNLKTYIIGPDMKNLDNLLNKKHFIGTIIK